MEPTTDPDHRQGAHGTGDVKAHLHRYLQRQHDALLWKLDGLSERDSRWPMTPTGTNLLGLLKHVASVEAEYFGHVFGRPFPEVVPWSADDAEDNADMWAGPEESVASVRDFAQRVWAQPTPPSRRCPSTPRATCPGGATGVR